MREDLTSLFCLQARDIPLKVCIIDMAHRKELTGTGMAAVVERLTASVLGLSALFRDASIVISDIQITLDQNDALEQFAIGSQQPLIQMMRIDLPFVRSRWALLTALPGELAVCCKNLVTAYNTYLQAHACLLSALTDSLRVLAASPWPAPAPLSTPDELCFACVEALFVNLWQIIINVSSVFDENMDVFHMCLLKELAAMQPVFHTLITWLTRLIRSDSPALAMVKRRGLNHLPWHHAVISLVFPAVWPIGVILQLPTHEQPLALSKLSRGFVTTMCCLACDLLGDGFLRFIPPSASHEMAGTFNPRHSSFVCDLAFKLNHLLIICTAHSQQDFPCRSELFCPASLEVVKLAVQLACTSTDPSAQPVASSALSCLINMLQAADTDNQAIHPLSRNSVLVQAPSSVAPSASSSTQVSDSFPRLYITDCLFLLQLWNYAHTQQQGSQQVTSIMQLILNSWTWKDILLHDPQCGACLKDLLFQSSKHVLCWMKGQRPLASQEQRPVTGHNAADMQQLGCLLIAAEMCVEARKKQGAYW